MSKSCHTTLFVVEWPKTFSPSAPRRKCKIEKQETPYKLKHCHISLLLSVTFIQQKQTPLRLQCFHTTVVYFSLVLCLLWVGSNLPPSYSGTHLSGGLGERERERAWKSRAWPSVLGAGSGTCSFLSRGAIYVQGRIKCALRCACPARRGVVNAMTSVDLFVLFPVGSPLSVCFPPQRFIVS